jgi:hypothetical protein
LIGTAFDPVYLTVTRRINQTLWQWVEKGEIKPCLVDVRRSEVLLETSEMVSSPNAFNDSQAHAFVTKNHILGEVEELFFTLL